MLFLTVGVAACVPPNIEFRRLDNVPYHPADLDELVVEDWDDLVALQGQVDPAHAARVVDVHRSDPAPGPGAPVIVYFPGGAWAHHNPDTLPETLERYVNQGWVVLTVDYTRASRSAPETQWPIQGHDADWAVRWVRANASALGVDGSKLVVAGHSAGAHLSAVVATARFAGAGNPALQALPGSDAGVLRATSSAPTALILLAGAYDLSAEGLPFQPAVPPHVPAHWSQQELLGCNAAAEPPNTSFPELIVCEPGRTDDASVVQAALGAFPPTFLAHSEGDIIVPFGPNTDALRQRLCATTPVRTWTERLAGSAHDFTNLDYAKVDYFLHRQGLLGEVPVAPTTWTCNQP